jgi:hypothetical protein
MNTKRFIKKFVILFSLFLVTIASCIPELKPQINEEDFKIYVLKDIFSDPTMRGKLNGSYEEVEPVIKDLSLDQPIFVITAADIEIYDWGQQTITLTKNATQRIGNPLQIEEKAFIIMLGKDKLYGGVVVGPGSARRLDFPVIYPYSPNKDQIELEIRPKHDFREYNEFDPKLKAIIEIDAVYTFFRNLGKIK